MPFRIYLNLVTSAFENQSTESTAGRAYMQIYNGWQARIQVLG